MPELFDRVIQQVDRIGGLNTRPAAVLIFFDKRCENVELVALFGPDRSAPELFDLPNCGGVIVVVSNGVNFHRTFLQNIATFGASIRSYSACVPINLINAMRLPKSKATTIRKLPPAISNLARSPFRIFAFGAARRTSSIELQLAALTNVLQR